MTKYNDLSYTTIAISEVQREHAFRLMTRSYHSELRSMGTDDYELSEILAKRFIEKLEHMARNFKPDQFYSGNDIRNFIGVTWYVE